MVRVVSSGWSRSLVVNNITLSLISWWETIKTNTSKLVTVGIHLRKYLDVFSFNTISPLFSLCPVLVPGLTKPLSRHSRDLWGIDWEPDSTRKLDFEIDHPLRLCRKATTCQNLADLQFSSISPFTKRGLFTQTVPTPAPWENNMCCFWTLPSPLYPETCKKTN